MQGRFRIRLVHFWYNALGCRRRHDFWQGPRSSANDKTIRLSLQIHKTAGDSKIYDVDVGEKTPGIVKATVMQHGRAGSATFEGVTLGRYGSNQGTVSGSISWECAGVQTL